MTENSSIVELIKGYLQESALKVMENIAREGKSNGEISPALLAEVINSMHMEHGHHLMQKWSMPEAYSKVVRDHHIDHWDQGNLLLAIVRLVDQACNKLGVGMRPEPDLVLFASAEAHVLGIKEITLAELEIVIEDAIELTLPGAR